METVLKTIIAHLKNIGLKVVKFERIEGGVSGAINMIAFLETNSFGLNRIVIKFNEEKRGVGERERKGAKLINGYLETPSPVMINGEIIDKDLPDIFISQYIPGPTLDSLVANGIQKRKEVIRKVIDLHVKMWAATLKSNMLITEVEGYPRKIEDTKKKLFFENFGNGKPREINIDGAKRELREIADLPIIFNGKELPSLNSLLDLAGHHIMLSRSFALLHGDEGAGNFMWLENGENGKIISVDNERVGIHCIEEGVAKFLCWFPAVHSNKKRADFNIVNDKLVIYFEIDISLFIKKVVREIREKLDELLKTEGINLELPIFHAFCAFYYFREIQWLIRRPQSPMGRNYMESSILCLGIQEAARCFRKSLV